MPELRTVSFPLYLIEEPEKCRTKNPRAAPFAARWSETTYPPFPPCCAHLPQWHKLQAVLWLCGGDIQSGFPSSCINLSDFITNLAATMTVKSQDPLAGINTSSTRTLLRVIVLLLIAGAAISSRLFSVIRKLSHP